MAGGDYSRAVIDFSWLVMAQPWSWRAHIALAGTWMMLKEYTTAINFYGHALMLDASHPEPVYQTGVCLKMMGEPGLARGFSNRNKDELCGCLME